MSRKTVLLVVLLVLSIAVAYWLNFVPEEEPLPAAQTTEPKIAVLPPLTNEIDKIQPIESPTPILNNANQNQNPLTDDNPDPTVGLNSIIEDESPFEFRQYIRDTGYKGIGERDLFALLIPPPPPPPPPRRTLEVITRNWVLWRITDENECIIADARPIEYTLRPGAQLEIATIYRIEPENNQVLLVNSEDTTDTIWMKLRPIEEVTRGWRLQGTVPSLKIAFILTGDNKQHTVNEGDLLGHVIVHEITATRVVLKHGTRTRDLTLGL